jgi:hypothetical protein
MAMTVVKDVHLHLIKITMMILSFLPQMGVILFYNQLQLGIINQKMSVVGFMEE